MKTIKINGVEFRVTRETSDTTVDQHYRFGVEPSGRGSFNVNQIIDATAPGVEVSISGHPDAVKGLFVTPSDPHSLIQRALSALGYVVGDHEKDVAQFSQWIDHLVKFPQSEEALGLWTNATLARLHATRSVDEASKDAQAIVIQRMRLFPPAPKTGLDDGPEIPRHIAEAQYAELQEWRSSANQRGWNSPLDMRGRTAADDVELGEWRSSASAFDIHSPKELASLTNVSFGELLDRKRRIELRNATGCETLDGVAELIRKLRAENGDREVCWRNATGRVSPEDAKARIDRLQEVEDYANACATSTKPKHPLVSAIENAPVVLISDEENAKLDEIAKSSRWLTDEEFKESLPVWGQVPNTGEVVFAASQSTLDQMSKKTQASWQEATGCPDPATAKERIKQLRAGYNSADAERNRLANEISTWKKETGRGGPQEAGRSIELLAERITHWQLVTGQQTPALASVCIKQLTSALNETEKSRHAAQAELSQYKRFLEEWQSKSGVASPNELVEKLRVTDDAWKEATGAADTHAAYKKIADLESKILSYASEIDALRKLPSSRRDWDIERSLAGAEYEKRVAAERELAKIKVELDSKRREYQTLKEEADTWKTEALTCGMTLVDIRTALEQKFTHLGSFANVSWNEFGKKAVSAINSAIIPLPKPDKVEPGQKWARIVHTKTPGEVHGSPSRDYVGSEIGILYKNRMLGKNDTHWVYLGQ